MKKIILIWCFLMLCGCANKESAINHQEEDKKTNQISTNDNQGEQEMNQITIEINNQEFQLNLYQNSCVEAFLNQLPQTFEMQDLHSNEKYYYLDTSLPTDQEAVKQIKAGDFMLFGDDCIVLFYQDFTTTYSYTRLGYVENVDEFVKEINNGNVSVSFRK